MRIIAGKHKGRIFDIPKGVDVRPTTDRVRESMFSSIISLIGELDNISVFDAFAGSGALGFESISRGATYLCSFEIDKSVFNNLIRNSKMFEDKNVELKYFCADIQKTKYIASRQAFDLLFFDPPYKNEPANVVDILNNIKSNNLLNNKALIVYEHSAKDSFSPHLEIFENNSYRLKKSKIYGEIAVEFLIWSGDPNE